MRVPPVQIGDVVYFYDRRRWVQAKERLNVPVPFAAIIASMNLFEGSAVASLTIFDPELGPLSKRDVPFSPEPRADHFTPRRVATAAAISVAELVPALKGLVEAAVAEQLAAATEPEDEAESA